jgi:hypothetical protein
MLVLSLLCQSGCLCSIAFEATQSLEGKLLDCVGVAQWIEIVTHEVVMC